MSLLGTKGPDQTSNKAVTDPRSRAYRIQVQVQRRHTSESGGEVLTDINNGPTTISSLSTVASSVRVRHE
jgi:hypothetical protein